MRANTMANSQNTSFSVTFAKHDKELAQSAPTPVPTKSEVGDHAALLTKTARCAWTLSRPKSHPHYSRY